MIKGLLNNIELYLSAMKLVLFGFINGVYESRMQVEYCCVDDELC